MKQADFGDELVLGFSAVSSIELGKRLPGHEVLNRLKVKFGVSTDWILYGDKAESVPQNVHPSVPLVEESAPEPYATTPAQAELEKEIGVLRQKVESQEATINAQLITIETLKSANSDKERIIQLHERSADQ